MRAMIASGIEPERDRGQDQMLDRVPGRLPVARDDPVEDVEVRWVLRLDEDVLAADARQPAELDREHPLEDDREEEDRDRDADQREEEARVVDRASVALRCDESERDPDQRREEHRADRELDRGREPLLDLLGDRASRRDARPEVARRRSSGGTASTARRRGRRARTGRGSGRSTRSVARSPRSDSAGDPGSARIQRKTSSESPIRIGTSRRSRRTAKRSTRSLPRRPPALDHWLSAPTRRSERLRTTPARPGSACSRSRSAGTPVQASCARTAHPGGSS